MVGGEEPSGAGLHLQLITTYAPLFDLYSSMAIHCVLYKSRWQLPEVVVQIFAT